MSRSTERLYTPDGKHITFDRNGINWAASGADSTPAQVLLPNTLPADPKQTAPETFYHPRAWSPDGTRLLLYFFAVVQVAPAGQVPVVAQP